MPKIDLITGFLGSGKTTFIRKYATYLLNKGLRVGILENDYGAVNVDMLLLHDLQGDNCNLEMISGGCDYDCHRRRFKTKLISMAMQGFDRVIVEPSGIYDVEEFFDVLQEDPIDRFYQPGNVITVVNAVTEEHRSEESEYLIASQCSVAGKVVFSRTGEASEEEIEETKAFLNEILTKYKCENRKEEDFVVKDWNDFTEDDYQLLLESKYREENYRKLYFHHDDIFQSLFFMHLSMTEEKLTEAVKRIFEATECGKVFRIKGFVPRLDGSWIELNATKDELHINTLNVGQEILIVIGEKLVQDKIESILLEATEK